MAEEFPEVATTSPEAFARLAPSRRDWLRRMRRLQAEWATRDLPAGHVIVKIRDRALSASRRAAVFLLLLFLTVIAGLTYFVGVPLWLDWQARVLDAERARAEAEIAAEERGLTQRFERLRASAATAAPLWLRQESGTWHSLRGVLFANASTGWAVGDGGTVLATGDGGQSWVAQPSGTEEPLWGVHFADARTGWAVGGGVSPFSTGVGGTILSTGDGGQSWVAQPSGTKEPLRGVHFADARTGWAVGGGFNPGEGGTVLATGDGGQSWVAQPSGTEEPLRGVHFADARTGWAVGGGGTVLATSDGGQSWAAQPSGTEEPLQGVHFADARTGWAVGGGVSPFSTGVGGTILSTGDGGQSWAAQPSGTEQNLYDVHFADARTGWAVGDGGTILRFTPELAERVMQATEGELKTELEDLQADYGVDTAAARREFNEIVAARDRVAELRARLAGQAATRREDPAVRAAADLAAAATDDAQRQRALAALEVALARADGSQDWWRYAADRVPAGILILFLLATLGSLYRYNVRVAGFYHARADALELMALEVDRERFDGLSATLGADGVEFKDTRTPADMAAEITKELIARLNLRPGP